MPEFVVLIEMLPFAGAFDAAEWSRTITGVSAHKALKLPQHRLLEPNPHSRAKSYPADSG
jgi:hypothetical protein